MTFTNKSPWRIVAEDGSEIELGVFLGDYDIGLMETSVAPLPVLTIVSNRTPQDFDFATAGIQTRTDDLDNDTDTPMPNREDPLCGSTGIDRISLEWLKAANEGEWRKAA